MSTKYTLKTIGKKISSRLYDVKGRSYADNDFFHNPDYHCFIETVNDGLKNIVRMEHSRHRCFDNFIVNLLGVIVLIVCFLRSPASIYKGPLTHSLHYSEFVELTLRISQIIGGIMPKMIVLKAIFLIK